MASTETPSVETNTSTKDSVTQPTVTADDTKEEEEIKLIDDINALFEEYRTTEDLKFDVTKKEKSQMLNEIKRRIKSIIDAVDEQYAYKLTLNIPVRLKNGKSNRKKGKDTSSSNNNNNDTSNNNNTSSSSTANGTITDSPKPEPNSDSNTNNNTNNNNPSSSSSSSFSSNTTTTKNTKNGGGGPITRAMYLYFLGRYHKICGNLSVSSPLLQEAVKSDPEIIDCWNTLGDIYYEQGEAVAAKYCFESALDFDRLNKIAYISLSKMLRKPTGKDQMEMMENCIESLILAKQALKFGRRKGSKSSNALKDGELWFNLGNAYLMAFLNCINGFKLDSSRKLQEEERLRLQQRTGTKLKRKGTLNEDEKDSNSSKDLKEGDSKDSSESLKDDGGSKDDKDGKSPDILHILDGLDDGMFEEERCQEAIYSELRREIEGELNDDTNHLLHHVYIRKCLSAYKCAATKCTINKHNHHPDLFCNRSHLHIYQEHYEEALSDLRQSIKFASIERGESQAQLVYDALLPKLVKMTKQIANKGGTKMAKKIHSLTAQIRLWTKQCTDYYVSQCHYDLVDFKTLSVGLNGGKVMVLKILALMQPANQLPFHFMSCDDRGSMFVLSFYLRGHALTQIQKVLNQPTVINAHTLISVANPVKRRIKFNYGNKHIDFHTITFQKPQDICIGGKFFFNQK